MFESQQTEIVSESLVATAPPISEASENKGIIVEEKKSRIFFLVYKIVGLLALITPAVLFSLPMNILNILPLGDVFFGFGPLVYAIFVTISALLFLFAWIILRSTLVRNKKLGIFSVAFSSLVLIIVIGLMSFVLFAK